jgi:hypothetical protein
VERFRGDDEDGIEIGVVQHRPDVGEPLRAVVAGHHRGDLVRLGIADRRQLDTGQLAEHRGVQLAEPSQSRQTDPHGLR